MPALNFLGNLGAIGGGYVNAQNELQQQQYRQILQALAQQQLHQQQSAQQSAGPTFQALLGGGFDNLMGGGGGGPPMAPGQGQQQPLPQVPQAAQQMAGGPGDVRGSWFGNSPGWSDPSDSGLQASGKPVSAGPGIALPDRSTLGQNFNVTAPSGQTMTLPQTDIGPAKWTGRGVDINAPAAQAFGYSPQNFPTDKLFHVVRADIQQTVGPEAVQAAQPATQQAIQSFGNPQAFAGRLDPSALARAIKKANPDQPDDVNMAVFSNLFPLLSNAGKAQFAQQWEMYKQGEHEREFGVAQREKQQEFGIRQGELQQNRQAMQGFAQQRLDQAAGKGEGQGFQFLQTPQGIVRANPRTGQVEPAGLPEGTTKVGGAGGGVSPSEIDFGVNYFKATGTLPVGSGRNRPLLNGIMTKLGSEGYDANKIAESAGTFKANQSSLAAATKLADAATSFENTALKNLDIATKQLHGAAATDLGPWINKWIETGETQAGNPGVPASVTAVLTFANEYAKVMSGATGAQGATVDSRREAAELFNPYFSSGQWDAVAAIATKDMTNRKESLYDQVDVIKSRIGRTGQQGSSEQGGMKAMPVPDQFKGEADGTSFQGKDGNVWVKKGNQMIQTPGAEVPPGQ